MIFISFLTGINSMMRGPYGFLLIVVLLFPIMGSTYKTLTFGEAISTWGIGVAGSLVYFSVSYMVYFWLGNMKGVIFTFITMAVLVIGFVFSVFNVGLEELMQVDKSIWVLCLWGMAAVFIALSYWISVKIYAKKHS